VLFIRPKRKQNATSHRVDSSLRSVMSPCDPKCSFTDFSVTLLGNCFTQTLLLIASAIFVKQAARVEESSGATVRATQENTTRCSIASAYSKCAWGLDIVFSPGRPWQPQHLDPPEWRVAMLGRQSPV